MKLFHFCSSKHIKQIMRQGLTMGAVVEPTATGFYIHNGWVWLTSDPDPTRQSWATRNQIKYSRTAWRLTVEIPDNIPDGFLHNRTTLSMIWPSTCALFDGWPGSENWRVFHGVIPKEWIVKAEKMVGDNARDFV